MAQAMWLGKVVFPCLTALDDAGMRSWSHPLALHQMCYAAADHDIEILEGILRSA